MALTLTLAAATLAVTTLSPADPASGADSFAARAGQLDVLSVNVAAPEPVGATSKVPEPDTSALLLAGFAATLLLARRVRRS
jgi:hypothetical protein